MEFISVSYPLPRLPKLITDLPGPKARALIDRDRAVTSPSYTRGYPLVAARGEGCTIEDVDGNVFLDLTAGIAVTNTGHCHPQVVQAIQAQSAQLLHMSGTDFYYEPMIELAEKLAKRAPFPECADGYPAKVFFTNSGAESLEGCLKLARYTTGRSQVVSFLGSFHGRTYGAMSLTGSKIVQRQGFSPLVPGITHIPYNHAGLDYLENMLFLSVLPPREVAAIFLEPIQGEGGYIVPETGFIERVRAICDRHGILMVLDEVQSGMGRTGKLFAIEHWDIQPDIVAIAKGIASGLPLGAFIARSQLMTWHPGSHATTFGGNPVACAAANITLELLETGLMTNSLARGEELQTGLSQLADSFSCLSQPRGKGLMVGIDVLNQEGELSPSRRNFIIDRAFYQGLLLLGCGKAAIRFSPPLVIDSEQIQIALAILKTILEDLP
ncbi:acetyl ornithine aminotransferase family protein [Merismopedia glauca]|uniref:(S)-3-amino-2-methylpropionate transaminase n=1 Tax=Merismopedia glauca CCAP 1448/3 TaxID=1296344 RepID=A0A2T1BWS3_9CYAN|nr:acetyl ornithine aminotransferase family protein [Merismopedia glauca]PSB00373.1 aspartate aminotransferase family protein [Merismopedia glauca CCAP 1448/3]